MSWARERFGRSRAMQVATRSGRAWLPACVAAVDQPQAAEQELRGAEPRGLPATHRQLDGETVQHRVVDAYRARLQVPRELLAAFAIARVLGSTSRAAKRLRRTTYTLLGYAGADGMPVIVPVEIGTADERGLTLRSVTPLPPGGRRAGLLGHSYRPQLIGLETRQHTGGWK